MMALLVCLVQPVDAHTRSYRRRHSIPAPLIPLVAARAAIHAVADPVLTAPLRVAFQTAQPVHERVYRARNIDESEVEDAQPTTVAYYVGRRTRPHPPRAESADAFDDDDDERAHNVGASEDFELKGGARPMVSGSRAVLRNGIAYAPANAPASVKNAIWAANTLRRKPYVWGGGHDSFNDGGYDCSGTVSFALHHAGVLATPVPSSDLLRFGQRGRGRWFTIYARAGHTFAVIAGLRLDTTDFYSGGNVGPRWHADMRDTFGYVARHPAGL
jgi:cell wall-associated NlpC family hydrolase